MFRDSQTALWEAAALSANAVSTNAYDLGAAFVGGTANADPVDPSVGQTMACVLTVGVAAKVSGTTETYEFDLIQSTVTGLSAPDVLVQVAFTNAQAAAALKAGAVVIIPMSAGRISKRFIGLQFVGANTPTITVTAWIAPLTMIQAQHFYASAIVIN